MPSLPARVKDRPLNLKNRKKNRVNFILLAALNMIQCFNTAAAVVAFSAALPSNRHVSFFGAASGLHPNYA
jgi:hypothetical protein